MKVKSYLIVMAIAASAICTTGTYATETTCTAGDAQSECCGMAKVCPGTDKGNALRMTLAKLSKPEEIVVWEALTPENRQQVWSDKMSQVLTLPWSEEEKGYLEGLQSMINSTNLFSTSVCPEDNVKLQEVLSYINAGKQKFGWPSNIEYWLIGTVADFPADQLPTNIK